MEFAFEETQQAVQDLAVEVLRREAGRVAGTSYEEATWKALGDAGLRGLAVPERLGGAGLGVLETSIVLTEIGRAAANVPALSTLAFGVLPIARHGTTAQQDGLLGDKPLTAALNEPSAPFPNSPRTTAIGDEPRVSGTKTGVLHADLAHRILVSVSTPIGAGVVLVDPGDDGVTLRKVPSSSGIEWAVRLDNARGEFLGAKPDQIVLDDLHACALAGICAMGDGAVAGALDLTAEHVRTRHQFGKPLAAFQAVSQQIADVYIAARTLHLAAQSACWRLGSGLDAVEDLDVATWWLAEEAPAVLRTCHHLHGGLGLDVTYPLHRYSSLITDLARLAGGAQHRLDLLAARA
ncbi:acyl-CoA/acyl-ACP dehydrogenase [Saccharopolyspora sp. K220]|uniref:acyl-CoA dehydrogenase family protein n=1 Tax=Saccharopolyspora soli TaxID=2926618 RepID=UPI001F5A83C0|nr:acyl-CoA dehydrogenase family protein [Saccharopolyspora soli]MCI2418098.1 acyl-CoA/acyl-ACP dehydrogenase [Saccharopolyspora soli]